MGCGPQYAVVGMGERYRVPARGTERAAAQEPADGQPKAAPSAVQLQRLEGVATARRGESARRRPAFHRPLIGEDPAHQPCTRASSWSRSNISSTNEHEAAAGVAPNRYEPAGSLEADEARRRPSRSRRRTRLRTTAGPRARPRANATRGGVAVPGGSRMKVHHSTPARARRPSADSRANALRSRIRQIKPTGGAAPWRGEP